MIDLSKLGIILLASPGTRALNITLFGKTAHFTLSVGALGIAVILALTTGTLTQREVTNKYQTDLDADIKNYGQTMETLIDTFQPEAGTQHHTAGTVQPRSIVLMTTGRCGIETSQQGT